MILTHSERTSPARTLEGDLYTLSSLTLSRLGEERTALPLADGGHYFFAKQFDGAHGRLV
jgi:hypothetical protein